MNKNAEQHLAKAQDYVAKGEEFYRKAAEEIIAAKEADSTLSNREAGEWFGYGESWVTDVVMRVTNPRGREEGRQKQDSASDRGKTKRVLRESTPEQVAAILEDPEIRRNLAKAQDLRHVEQVQKSEKALREEVGDAFVDDLAEEQRLRNAESKVFEARRALRDMLTLLNEADLNAMRDSWREDFLKTLDDIAMRVEVAKSLLGGTLDADLEQFLQEV